MCRRSGLPTFRHDIHHRVKSALVLVAPCSRPPWHQTTSPPSSLTLTPSYGRQGPPSKAARHPPGSSSRTASAAPFCFHRSPTTPMAPREHGAPSAPPFLSGVGPGAPQREQWATSLVRLTSRATTVAEAGVSASRGFDECGVGAALATSCGEKLATSPPVLAHLDLQRLSTDVLGPPRSGWASTHRTPYGQQFRDVAPRSVPITRRYSMRACEVVGSLASLVDPHAARPWRRHGLTQPSLCRPF